MSDAEQQPAPAIVQILEDEDDEAYSASQRVAELEAYAGELEKRNLELIKQARLAELDKNKEAKIAAVLEARLGEVTGRKLALQVAHGDVPPEQFEQRRKIEVEGIRNLIAALRV